MCVRGDHGIRSRIKSGLAALPQGGPARGITLLIFHRVGGGTTNELDLDVDTFTRQLAILDRHDVISLDAAVDRLEAGDDRPAVVLTFDDGFADVHANAWPLLRERHLPFTIYLASAYMGATMRWEGATATGAPGQGLTWGQVQEMSDSGLCTLGNHTHGHVRPSELTEAELDACTRTIHEHVGVTPQHFTYPWGIAVPHLEDALRARFRSASTGVLGRNMPGENLMMLNRVPVRRTDPDTFFEAKLSGDLRGEAAYAALVGVAKRLTGSPAQ